MALFPNSERIVQGGYGKTHTKLELSNGQAPAEKFTIARGNEFKPFIYEYGPAGLQTVILPKGKLVMSAGTEYNPDTGFEETAIQVAGDGATNVLGVNQHNIYETRRGAMQGTAATVLSRSYIEVPLFETNDAKTAANTADAVKFGAAYGKTNDLQPGDYVVAGQGGNFRKFNDAKTGGDDPLAVVGKVWGVTRELPPAGALQYYTGLEGDALKQVMNDLSGYAGSGDGPKPGSPFSNGAWLPDFFKAIGTGDMKGIPFLTDGYFSAKERLEKITLDSDNVEVVRAQDGVTVTGGNVTVGANVEESMVVVKLKHQIDPLDTSNTKVRVGGKELSSRDVHVDLRENAVVIYLAKGQTGAVEIDADLIVNPTAGIPTEWDHKGSVGAVRILLNQ